MRCNCSLISKLSFIESQDVSTQDFFLKIPKTQKRLETIISFIPFFIYGHLWGQSYENMIILRNLCLHFARQDGQDRQDGKKGKENHANKATKIPKNKRQMG